MRNALCIAAVLASLHATPAHAAETQQREEVQADISTREVHIKADFTGIEILIFGRSRDRARRWSRGGKNAWPAYS